MQKDKSSGELIPVKHEENRTDFHYKERKAEDVDGRGKHPNSQANLKPFPKGVSGNPEGRQGAFVELYEALNKLGDKMNYKRDWDSVLDEFIEDGTNRENVLETIWNKAKDGDMKFIELLAKLGCLTPK